MSRGGFRPSEAWLAAHEQRMKQALREVEPGVIGVRVDPKATIRERKPTVQHEELEQMQLIAWAKFVEVGPWLLSDLLMHPANGGKRSKRTAARMKAMGVQAGYPDLILDIPAGPYHGARWEGKHGDRETSDSQDVWHDRLRELGYYVNVYWQPQDAAEDIMRYLSAQSRYPVIVHARFPT